MTFIPQCFNVDNKILWFNVSKALDKSRKILKGALILSILKFK